MSPDFVSALVRTLMRTDPGHEVAQFVPLDENPNVFIPELLLDPCEKPLERAFRAGYAAAVECVPDDVSVTQAWLTYKEHA